MGTVALFGRIVAVVCDIKVERKTSKKTMVKSIIFIGATLNGIALSLIMLVTGLLTGVMRKKDV